MRGAAPALRGKQGSDFLSSAEDDNTASVILPSAASGTLPHRPFCACAEPFAAFTMSPTGGVPLLGLAQKVLHFPLETHQLSSDKKSNEIPVPCTVLRYN